MPIVGNLSALTAMQAQIGKAIGLAAKVAPVVAPKLRDFVREGFATKTDAYGGAWAAIKAATRKRGSQSALVRTGRMRDKIDYLPFATKVKLVLGTFYARFHISTGRRTLPKPGMLPPRWGDEIEQESARQFQALVGGP